MGHYGEIQRGGRGVGFFIGLLATVLLHGGIAGGILFFRARANASQLPLLKGQVVDVQAVKFGKPRDLSFLPHKEMVTTNKGPKPKIALTENEKALPKPPKPDEKKPDQEDPLKRTHAELFKNETDQEQKGSVEEGDPHGLKGGTATVGKGPVYYQHLQAAVQNAWVVPTTIAEDRLARLKATACIKIAADGKIIERGLRSSSGDDRFDATLMQAIDSLGQFEAPTSDVKDVVTSDGVCMNFAKTR